MARRRRRLCALRPYFIGTALVFATPAFAAGTAAATHITDEVACGGLAPFSNTCTDGPHWIEWPASGSVAVFGFVGRIKVELTQSHWLPPHYGARLTWTCDAMLLSTLTTCSEPVQTGYFFVFLPVTLECRVSHHPWSLGLVPPAGPWGCRFGTVRGSS